jgi:hypothetical protein
MSLRCQTSLLARTSAIAVAASVLAASAAAQNGPSRGKELLPDLDQETPSGLMIANVNPGGPPSYVLGFRSAVRNIGDGPLTIVGRRAGRATPTMSATQVIERRDGSRRMRRAGARLRYAVSPDHQHWHLLHFDRYELRRAGDASGAFVRDQKTGFCLGDRYRVLDRHVAAALPAPSYRSRCGLGKTELLSVTEGISPGYGDDYKPYLEGQSLPLTGLAAGRYVLTHRVNAERQLRESDYGNDAASVVIELEWQSEQPKMRVLAACPDSAECEVPEAQTARARVVPRGATSALWNPTRRLGVQWALCR